MIQNNFDEFVVEKEKAELINTTGCDIFNALNLVNEDLGALHASDGFNPFDDDFVLDVEYVKSVLTNQKQAPEIPSPEFVEQGIKATKIAFENLEQNLEPVIKDLEEKLQEFSLDNEQKSAIKKHLAHLKMQTALATDYKIKLKKEQNALQMYKNIISVNWEIQKYIETAFKENWQKEELLNFILTLKNKKRIKDEQENQILIQKAKQIVAKNNAKIQSQQKISTKAKLPPSKAPHTTQDTDLSR